MESMAGSSRAAAGPYVPEALAPDLDATPDGFVVEIAPGERIHFLDWGGPAEDAGGERQPTGPQVGDRRVSVLLIHGLGGTAWAWTAVARRLRRGIRTVAMDLRGHGLSDAPTDSYTPDALAGDVLAVAEGAGLVSLPAVVGEPDETARVVLVGHGYGAMVAAWTAASNVAQCAGLVLVDGGWQDVAAETGLTPTEWLRDLAEPPEVLRSMAAYLADRRDWDPSSWNADEEYAARVAVVEVPAGKVVSAVRPHALERSVEALFAYVPEAVLVALDVPIVAGTKQTLPVGSIMLVRLNRNMGSSGAVPGEAPRRVSMAMMDLHRPTWNADTPTLVVKNWMYDTRTPRVYYVYPPMSGATTLEAEYSVIPAVVASGTDTIALDDFYVNPIIDYVLWRAFSKDIEIPGMKSKAEAHRAAFDQSLDMTKAGEETNK